MVTDHWSGYGTNARPAGGNSSQSGLETAEATVTIEKEKDGSGESEEKSEEMVRSDAPTQQGNFRRQLYVDNGVHIGPLVHLRIFRSPFRWMGVLGVVLCATHFAPRGL